MENTTDHLHSHESEIRATDGQASNELPYAGNGKRFLNFVLDMLVMFVVIVISSLGLMIAGLGDAVNSIEHIPNFAFGVIISLIFYFPFEALTGRTPGKMITGTRVVQENGSRATMAQILGRSLIRCVPFEPISFFIGEGPVKGWHDKWSKTTVIRTR
jgi:uncharacterized RDD family membrane protein YckC